MFYFKMAAFSLFLLEAQRDFFSDLQSEKLIGLLEVLGWPKKVRLGFSKRCYKKTQTNFFGQPNKIQERGGSPRLGSLGSSPH